MLINRSSLLYTVLLLAALTGCATGPQSAGESADAQAAQEAEPAAQPASPEEGVAAAVDSSGVKNPTRTVGDESDAAPKGRTLGADPDADGPGDSVISDKMHDGKTALNERTMPATLPEPPEGWTQYNVPQPGFTVSLPPSWFSFDLEGDVIEQFVSQGLAEYPDFSEQVRAQLDSADELGAIFFGADTEDIDSDFLTNVNALPLEFPVELDLATVAEANAAQFRSAFDLKSPIEQTEYTLPSGTRVARLNAVWSLPQDPSGTVFATSFYFALRGASGVLLTFVTSEDRQEEGFATFKEIMDTFVLW
jgi:hypothetical protein